MQSRCRCLLLLLVSTWHAGASVAEEVTAPLSLELAYTAAVLSNIEGGLQTDTRYLDNLDVIASVDMGRLFGIEGGTLFAYGLYNNRHTFSEDIVGDFQVASNIEAVEAVRLCEFWYEQAFSGTGASVRFGLYALNSEFDVVDTGGLFLNSAHGIGTEFGQSGEAGPSIFPVTSLALRVQLQPTERLTLRAAVLDATPGDPQRPKRTTIDLDSDDGALAVLEAA